MTMVAACKFHDGAVMIADSRATWTQGSARVFQDTLQKILPLGRMMGLGFAGDVQAAEAVVRHLRLRIRAKPRLQNTVKLALEIPRIARHYYVHRQTVGKDRHSLAIVLGGIHSSGRVGVWCFESPRFEGRELKGGFAVVGSGSVVAPYLENNVERIGRDLPDLKARADALLVGLQDELKRAGESTVGGMLQVITLASDGIRPLRHGFMSLDPEGPAFGRHMEMVSGRWVQTDVTTGQKIPLTEPSRLISGGPQETRVLDFHIPTGEPTSPRWHLSYFVTCGSVKTTSGSVEFRRVISAVGSREYPFSFPVIIAVGFWGSAGQHELELLLEQDGVTELVRKETVNVEVMPVQVDWVSEGMLTVQKPGPAFLICRMGGQLLGRRALYFGHVDHAIPDDEAERTKLAQECAARLREEQGAQPDPLIEKTGQTILEYLSLCQRCHYQGMTLRFENEVAAVYWKSYPLKLRVFVASAFRMPQGKHSVRLDLVNAGTRETTPMSRDTVESVLSGRAVPIHGELVVMVPKTGIYFVNVYVDEKLVGTAVLPAEDDHPRYSYTLTAPDAAQVAAGELLMLCKRSRQRSE